MLTTLAAVVRTVRRLVRLAVGWERLIFGFCPECNSDAPAKYSCRICTPCAYPPSAFTKHLWWTRFKQANKALSDLGH